MYFMLAIYAFIGLLAGFSGGLLGIGGGLVTVPSLFFLFHFLGFPSEHSMQMALGTSLSAMLFTAASSACSHYLKNGINWQFFTYLSPGIIVGSLAGALIADYLPSKELKMIFGICAILVGFSFLLPHKEKEKTGSTLHLPLLALIGTGIGTVSTLLGIGGGIMTVPVLTFFRAPLRNAISTSAMVGFLIAFVGAISFLILGLKQQTMSESVGYVYLPAFIMIGLTSVLSAPFGAKLVYILPTDILRKIFGLFLLIVGVLMLF